MQPLIQGLNPKQQQAFDKLLARLDVEPLIQDLRHCAYFLATVRHETAGTYQPIEEYGKGKGKPYGELVEYKGIPHGYWGRGFVQCTWLTNYLKMGKAIGMGDELAQHPEKMLEFEISFASNVIGMMKGLYTGKSLPDYIHGDTCDYINCRRIINGLSGAEKVAGYAVEFEKALRNRP